MKKLLIATTSVILATSFVQAAETTVNGGTVNFTGEFVNAACAVSSNSSNQVVDLGQYRTAKLTAVGQFTGPVPFQIDLIDCDPAVATSAVFTFNGQVDADDATLFRVSSDSANGTSAQGVGIEISDAKNTVLSPNVKGVNPTQLAEGTTTAYFSARYKSTSAAASGEGADAKYAVTAGKANTTANFVITYQ